MPIRVETPALQEGMILAEPIVNRQGQVLLPGGTSLSGRHIIILKTWGISHASIQSGQDDSSPNQEVPFSEEVLARAKERLEQRWNWKPRNPIEEEIFRAALQRSAQIIVKGD